MKHWYPISFRLRSLQPYYRKQAFQRYNQQASVGLLPAAADGEVIQQPEIPILVYADMLRIR
jgi:hypothetical protein